MKNTLFFLCILCLYSSCSHKTYEALQWQSNKVTVDAKIPEWENPLRFYDDKSKINYTISNDRRNLYVCMKVSDETAQVKILRGGMEFRIDTLATKKFPIALLFPMPNQLILQRKKNEGQSEKNSEQKTNRPDIKQKLLSQAKDIQLIGFKPPLGGIMPLLNTTSGIAAAINIDSTGILYYEAVIPFSTFYKNELTDADANKVFNYEIKINSLPASPMHEGDGGGGHHGGGGGGMRGGGGMGRGGMGGGGMGGGMGRGGMGGGGMGRGGYSSANSEMHVTNQITTKLRLSYK